VYLMALCLATVLACSAFSFSLHSSGRIRATPTISKIIHHAGAYQPVTSGELHDLLSGGMSLVLDQPSIIRKLEASAPLSPALYIDNLLQIVYQNVSGLEPISSPKSCIRHLITRGCVITAADVKHIHKAISAELRRARGDLHIVGFYIQDDPFGNTRKLEQDIHNWVSQARLNRPTICGVEGRLDVPTSKSWMRNLPSFVNDVLGNSRAGIPRSLDNYSPRGCDMVALYPFGPQAFNKRDAAALAAATDWQMSRAIWPCGADKCTLLKFYKYALSRRGWTPATPLIGVPQAFGLNIPIARGKRFIWPEPSARQLAGETAAFCAGGTQSVLAWAWHDFDRGSTSPYVNPSLRKGLAAGVRTCHLIWSRDTFVSGTRYTRRSL
jgi:hypothetical protein